MKSLCALPVGTVLPLPIVTAPGFSAEALGSSSVSFSTLARISFVGSTQSIGMELHISVGQLSRSGPLSRVPPATWISRPLIIVPQTRQ
jgi:hypothetical protein